MVERVLRDAGFERVDAYRYNAASIRLRVIDQRFEGKAVEKRDAMVERHLKKLPDRTQGDIISLFTFAPSELQQTPKPLREALLNLEFEAQPVDVVGQGTRVSNRDSGWGSLQRVVRPGSVPGSTARDTARCAQPNAA